MVHHRAACAVLIAGAAVYARQLYATGVLKKTLTATGKGLLLLGLIAVLLVDIEVSTGAISFADFSSIADL